MEVGTDQVLIEMLQVLLLSSVVTMPPSWNQPTSSGPSGQSAAAKTGSEAAAPQSQAARGECLLRACFRACFRARAFFHVPSKSRHYGLARSLLFEGEDSNEEKPIEGLSELRLRGGSWRNLASQWPRVLFSSAMAVPAALWRSSQHGPWMDFSSGETWDVAGLAKAGVHESIHPCIRSCWLTCEPANSCMLAIIWQSEGGCTHAQASVAAAAPQKMRCQSVSQSVARRGEAILNDGWAS